MFVRPSVLALAGCAAVASAGAVNFDLSSGGQSWNNSLIFSNPELSILATAFAPYPVQSTLTQTSAGLGVDDGGFGGSASEIDNDPFQEAIYFHLSKTAYLTTITFSNVSLGDDALLFYIDSNHDGRLQSVEMYSLSWTGFNPGPGITVLGNGIVQLNLEALVGAPVLVTDFALAAAPDWILDDNDFSILGLGFNVPGNTVSTVPVPTAGFTGLLGLSALAARRRR